MTPVKTCFLLLLSVLLIASTVSEVVQSMTQCGDFLLDKVPQVPGILENGQIKGKNTYKVICQTYKNVRRFVTLYDTKNRIPVLSAYKFTGATEGRPDVPWKIEPQLEDMKNGKTMEGSSQSEEYQNQAGDKDYNDATAYDKGHLFPSSYANNEDDKISTFTLTNAVPQVSSFNQGSWARMETCVKCVMEKLCINNNNINEGYVMTGATPSVSNKINNRVNVPSLLWSAFCCYSKNLNRWIASAYWGDNVKYKVDNPKLPKKTLKQLHDQLKDGPTPFEAFPGSRCPLDQTVDELKGNCSCV